MGNVPRNVAMSPVMWHWLTRQTFLRCGEREMMRTDSENYQTGEGEYALDHITYRKFLFRRVIWSLNKIRLKIIVSQSVRGRWGRGFVPSTPSGSALGMGDIIYCLTEYFYSIAPFCSTGIVLLNFARLVKTQIKFRRILTLFAFHEFLHELYQFIPNYCSMMGVILFWPRAPVARGKRGRYTSMGYGV